MYKYREGRDHLISGLYNEIWIKEQINDQKAIDLNIQAEMITGLQTENIQLTGKVKRKNKTILILILVDVVVILGVLVVK